MGSGSHMRHSIKHILAPGWLCAAMLVEDGLRPAPDSAHDGRRSHGGSGHAGWGPAEMRSGARARFATPPIARLRASRSSGWPRNRSIPTSRRSGKRSSRRLASSCGSRKKKSARNKKPRPKWTRTPCPSCRSSRASAKGTAPRAPAQRRPERATAGGQRDPLSPRVASLATCCQIDACPWPRPGILRG